MVRAEVRELSMTRSIAANMIACVNGLRDIVVHARRQTAFAISYHGVSGHGYDGNMFSRRPFRIAHPFLFSNQGRGLEPIHFRHLHIHQDQVEGLFLPCRQRLPSGLRQNDRVSSLLQESHRHFLVYQIVFRQQDPEMPLACAGAEVTALSDSTTLPGPIKASLIASRRSARLIGFDK